MYWLTYFFFYEIINRIWLSFYILFNFQFLHLKFLSLYLSEISKIFLKKFCFAHQGCIYWIKNTVKTILLWYITTIKKNRFFPYFLLKYILKCISVMSKLNFQFSKSYDLSEIILIICRFFYAQEIFLIKLENFCAAWCFCANQDTFLSGFFD